MKKNSIVDKIFILLMSSIIILGFLLSFFVSSNFLSKYFEENRVKNDVFIKNIYESIEEELTMVEQVVNSISSTVSTEEIKKKSKMFNGLNEVEDEYATYFTKLLSNDDFISDSVYIYFNPHLDGDVHDVWMTREEDGNIIRHEEVPLIRYLNNDNMDWFYLPENAGISLWIEPYTNRYGKVITSYVTPIFDDDYYIGMVGVYFDFTEIENRINSASLYDDDNLWIENEEGVIIHQSMHELSDDITREEIRKYFKDYHMYEFELHNGWSLVYAIPMQEIVGIKRKLYFNSILIFGVIIVFIYLVLNVVRKKYKQNFNQIMEVLKKIRSGDFSEKLDIKTNDEISEIAYVINGAIENISELIRVQQHLAYENQITSFPNKNKLLKDLKEKKVSKFTAFGLFYIDIDDFKIINDILGHESGDLVISDISKKLQSLVIEIDNTFLYHVNGDEFVLIVNEIYSDREVKKVCHAISNLFEEKYVRNSYEFSITCSIGVGVFPKHSNDINELLRCVDVAVHEAKAVGKNTSVIYNEEMYVKLLDFNELENDFKEALEKDQFVVYYQPKVSAINGSVNSMEALVRWNHPTKGLLFPGYFIDYAENSGYIKELGEVVLRKACKQNALWNKKYNLDLVVAVNLSMRQLLEEDIVERTLSIIEEEDLKPSQLEYEITESMVITDRESSIEKLRKLNDIGMEISLDDFGTGYSTLGNIVEIPIDKIKLDKSFIDKIEEKDVAFKFISSMIKLAHNLSIRVVAEGVESKEQVELLKTLKCDVFQGYYYSKPISAQEFEEKIIKKLDESPRD